MESVWFHDGPPVFKFRGIDTISDAERWWGRSQAPASERMPLDAGEFYQADLIGCEVVDRRTGETLGECPRLHEAGGPDCWSLEDELLIPFARAICVEIDPAREADRGRPAGRSEGPESGVIFHVLTIFPEFFEGPFEHGVVKRARDAGRSTSTFTICGTGLQTGTRLWTTVRSAAARAWC